MNKEYLPYYDSLDEKYRQIYMEWSKEELIDHLVANIKNGEVLLSRIDEAIEYIEKCGGMELVNDYSFPEKPIIDKEAKTNLLNILKGSDKE